MRVFSMPQRKAVSLGLLWGILSVAEIEGTALGGLRIPLQVATACCNACGFSSPSMLIYALAILFATVTAYLLVTAAQRLNSKVFYWHAGPSKSSKGRNQQGRNE